MRLLIVHNRYQQRGGEDGVLEAEVSLLERNGHDVEVFERHNDEILSYSPLQRLDLVRRTLWATDSSRSLRSLLSRHRPQVVHFHNTFPLISPAAYHVCAAAGAAVVQTISNYRLICPGALLQRDGGLCEDCVAAAVPWPGVLHGCYRGSRAQSAVVAGMLVFHRMAGTWDEKVDVYITLTEFARRKLIEGGLPPHKVAVKPNFLYPDPGLRATESDYALFVGRLAPEKGVTTLLQAWERLPEIPLKIAGDGPLSDAVAQAARSGGRTRIEPLGWRPWDEILELMKAARFLVFPSEWYEGFPLTIVESFACGVPVVGSRLGGMSEVIQEERSGLLFEPGDSEDLARAISRLWDDDELRRQLSRRARWQFEALYSAERNHALLMEIYERALASRS